MNADHDSITHLVSMLHRRTRAYFARELKPWGLTSTHFRALHFLYANDGARQEDLRRHLDMDKGAAAHATKRLVELGLAVRDRHPVDGRAYVIHTTPEAHRFFEEFARVMQSWDDRLVSGLRADEMRQAEEILQRLLDNTGEPGEGPCAEPRPHGRRPA